MKVARICAVTVAVLLFAYTPLVLAQGLDSVFGQDRSGTEDVINLRNGETISGTILNNAISITTSYGTVKAPVQDCAGVSFEAWGVDVDVLAAVNFNRLSGLISDRTFKIKSANGGAVKAFRKEEIKSIIFKKSQAEDSAAAPRTGSSLFIMTNGDVLTGQAMVKGSVSDIELDLGWSIQSVFPGMFSEKTDNPAQDDVKEAFFGAALNPQTSPASMEEARGDAPDEILLANKGFARDYVGPVEFSHRSHFEDYGVTCAACHHWQADPVWSCNSCHKPDSKIGKVVDLKNAYHTDCKGCHEAAFKAGKTSAPFAKCSDCHQAKE